MSRPRRFLVFLALLVVVAGVLWWLAWSYLSSQRITAKVASRLQAAYGAPVQVQHAEIGVGGSSLQDVQLFESHASAQEPPWLVINNVQANIPFWALIKTGALPSRLTLNGVAITLRFDKDGRLLTRIPISGSKRETLPDITIENGQITIQQIGHPDFVVTGVHVDVQDRNQLLALAATVSDPTCGHWTLDGSLNRKTDAGSATLKTPDVHFTQAKLERLPFVPQKIWKEVALRGNTAIDGTMRYDPETKQADYHITLQPRATEVCVPSIELCADHGQGRIVVQNGIITVADLQARAADGEIKATGKIDFQRSSLQLDFKVDASKLDLDKIPKSWGLPQFPGKPLLSGRADLQARVVDGKIRTSGSGQGRISGVRIPGAPESKPILLKLYPSERGFRFGNPMPESGVRGNSARAATAFVAVALLAPAAPPPRQPPIFSPARFANWIGTGVIRGVDALVRTGTMFIARLPKRRPAQAKPQAAPSYLEAQLGLDEVDVVQLIKGLRIPLPFPVSGRLSFNVQLAFPLNTPRDLKTYRLRGTASSPKLFVAGQELDSLRARVAYSDGVLKLEKLSGYNPAEPNQEKAGSFQGTAELQIIPPGDLTARLKLAAIPLDHVLAVFLPTVAEQARGAFSGEVEVQVPANRIRDPAAWLVSGTISSQRPELYGMALDDVALLLRAHQGQAVIQLTRGRLHGTPISASAELQLVQPYSFTANLSIRRADLAALQHLSPALKPPVSINGHLDAVAEIKGSLSPFAFHISGHGAARDLTVDRLKVGALTFRWQGDANRIRVRDLHARLYGGELTGSAVLPLRPTIAGSVDLRIQDLDVGALSQALPNLPTRLEGRATGSLAGTLSPVEGGRSREFTSKLELQAPQLRVQGIPTERLHGSVDYRNQALTYHFDGETLGGRLHLNGQIPVTKPQPSAPPPPEGHLQVEGVRLGRLVDVLHLRSFLPVLKGVLNLDVAFRHTGPHREPIGAGRFSLQGLRWGEANRTGTVRGEVILAAGEVRLRNAAGEFAGGLLHGQLAINLRRLDQSWFTVALDQVDASRLLAPWPTLAERVEGTLDMQLRGRLGREWYGGGELAVARARLFGVEAFDWQLPFEWAFAPALGTGQVLVPDSTGQLALGRVTSRASLRWGTGLRVEGHLRFLGMELRPLLRQFSTLSQLGTGRVSGRFDFSGTDVRSIDDLTGTLEARLQQTQALQLPVLQQLTPFLLGGQSSAAVFQNGSLRARLGGGTLRIEQLSFAGRLTQLFINGSVTLLGRLDLHVLVNTGTLGVNPTFVRFLGLRIPAAGPIPVTLLLEASTYFSNRLIRLRVTGTVRSPIITIQPFSLLSEEALRFFINRSNLPVP
jgi:translocation and assembly module TamB